MDRMRGAEANPRLASATLINSSHSDRTENNAVLPMIFVKVTDTKKVKKFAPFSRFSVSMFMTLVMFGGYVAKKCTFKTIYCL